MHVEGLPDHVKSFPHTRNLSLSGVNPTSHEYVATNPGRIEPSISRISTCPFVGSASCGHCSFSVI